MKKFAKKIIKNNINKFYVKKVKETTTVSQIREQMRCELETERRIIYIREIEIRKKDEKIKELKEIIIKKGEKDNLIITWIGVCIIAIIITINFN